MTEYILYFLYRYYIHFHNINLSNFQLLVEAVESAKANAAPCRKAPPGNPQNDSGIPNQKVLKGLQFCSKDMFENSETS